MDVTSRPSKITVTELSLAQSAHVQRVKELADEHSRFLGFFPSAAFDDHILRGKVLIAESIEGQCAGYVFFNVAREYVRIAHLCVDTAFQGQGIARALVAKLASRYPRHSGIRLNCRLDFPANNLWPKLGFVAVGEKPGRNSKGHPLILWLHDHGHKDLFSLDADAQTASIVAIDTNILLDLKDPNRPSAAIAHALRADWLRDVVELYITDEVRHDINHNRDGATRQRSKSFAATFPTLTCTPGQFAEFQEKLRPLFPTKINLNTEGDVRHLARAAAGGAAYFVTRDDGLLAMSDEVLRVVPLTIIDPVGLIAQLHIVQNPGEYQPVQFIGSTLSLRRVGGNDVEKISTVFYNREQEQGPAYLKALVQRCVATPGCFRVEVLAEGRSKLLALAAVATPVTYGAVMDVPILRVASEIRGPTVARQIIRHLLCLAGDRKANITRITDVGSCQTVKSALNASGFNTVGSMEKVNVFGSLDSSELAEFGRSLAPLGLENGAGYQRWIDFIEKPSTWDDAETVAREEHRIWPGKIRNGDMTNFVVPITPHWAAELVDHSLAGLYPRNHTTALNVEGVFYRSCYGCTVTAPARVLWYVSHSSKTDGSRAVRACSRVVEVRRGTPKVLFKEFRRLGIYEWNDVFRTAGRKMDKDIMAIRFDDTELFPVPVPYKSLVKELDNIRANRYMQCPVRLPTESFFKIYNQGFR